MKTEAMAVLVLARQKAKASNVKPVWVTLPKPTQPAVRRADDGRQEWERFKTECVLLTKKEV
jgi:hypothetical protein